MPRQRSDPGPPDRRRRRTAAVALLLLLGTLAAPAAAAAERLPPATAAVIDYQRVFKDAKAARAIGDQVDARRQLYQEEIAREEQRLHEADKQLSEQRSVLSPEAYAERRREFERQVAEVQRKVQERRRQLDQAKAVALNEMRSAMIEIVAKLSDARGFNLVLPTSGVLLFAPQIDLTEEVIGRLDVELPSVKVPERVD
jgi:Skp family chaperone for outer membrane proteins